MGRFRSDKQPYAEGRAYRTRLRTRLGDVSPVTGVLLGGGDHEVAVGVDVNPAGSSPAAAPELFPRAGAVLRLAVGVRVGGIMLDDGRHHAALRIVQPG